MAKQNIISRNKKNQIKAKCCDSEQKPSKIGFQARDSQKVFEVLVDELFENVCNFFTARDNKTDKKTVDRYMQIPEKQLPPITCSWNPKEPALHNQVIDGFHRLKALKANGAKKIKVLYVEVMNAEQAYFISLELNNRHGRQLSKEELRLNVIRLKTVLKKTQKEIADMLSISQPTVCRLLKEKDTKGKRRKKAKESSSDNSKKKSGFAYSTVPTFGLLINPRIKVKSGLEKQETMQKLVRIITEANGSDSEDWDLVLTKNTVEFLQEICVVD